MNEIFDHKWTVAQTRCAQIAHILEFDIVMGSDFEVRCLKYSGRGMMGKNCMSITGTNEECRLVVAQLQWHIAMLLAEEASADAGCLEDLRNLSFPIFMDIMSYKTEMIGHQVVVYWESFPCADEVDDVQP